MATISGRLGDLEKRTQTRRTLAPLSDETRAMLAKLYEPMPEGVPLTAEEAAKLSWDLDALMERKFAEGRAWLAGH